LGFWGKSVHKLIFCRHVAPSGLVRVFLCRPGGPPSPAKRGTAQIPQQGDAESLQREAHTLKGAALNLSAQGVSAAALRLEQIGREGNLSAGKKALRELNDDLVRLETYVDQPGWKTEILNNF